MNGWTLLFIVIIFLLVFQSSSPPKKGWGSVVVKGPIQESQWFIDTLDTLEKTPNILGLIIHINSPGGEVVPSKEMFAALQQFSKPSVALIRDTATSGGYWIALGADYIIADSTSIIGSVGASASYLEYQGLIRELGITYHEICSGPFKNSGSPFRTPSPEEVKWRTYMVNEIRNEFLATIVFKRNIDETTLDLLGSGVPLTGKMGLHLKLIDALGTEQDVLEWLNRHRTEKVSHLFRFDSPHIVLPELNMFQKLAQF